MTGPRDQRVMAGSRALLWTTPVQRFSGRCQQALGTAAAGPPRATSAVRPVLPCTAHPGCWQPALAPPPPAHTRSLPDPPAQARCVGVLPLYNSSVVATCLHRVCTKAAPCGQPAQWPQQGCAAAARAIGARRREMLADPAPNLSTTCGLSASLLAAPATSSGSPFWLSSTWARPRRGRRQREQGGPTGALPGGAADCCRPPVLPAASRASPWGGGRSAPRLRESGQRHAALHTTVRKAELPQSVLRPARRQAARRSAGRQRVRGRGRAPHLALVQDLQPLLASLAAPRVELVAIHDRGLHMQQATLLRCVLHRVPMPQAPYIGGLHAAVRCVLRRDAAALQSRVPRL